MKWNYLTEKEAEMPPDAVDLQIVLGLQYCNTKAEVLALLEDVRQHERMLIIKKQKDRISKALTQDEKEKYY